MGQRSMKRPPKHVQGFVDRYGKARFYFRRPGYKRIPLPGLPWSPSFMAAYEAALNGAPAVEIGASRTVSGTVNAVIVGYYSHPLWDALQPTTQSMRRAILERFRAQHGDKRIATLEKRHVEDILGKLKPFAAKNWLKTLRGLLKYAVAARHRGSDPTEGVKTTKPRKSDGFLTWSEDQIAEYRRRYKLGTRARLALELLIGTGQARGDVVRMGRQHVRDGVLSIRRKKTNVPVEIPVLPELQEALDAMPPSEHLTFLTTASGKSFSAAGFGNLFRDLCNEAGLPKGYAAHGLRKAAATRHANAGATAHELMAWFGWTSIREAERYTKRADRARLALGMATKLRTGTASVKPS